MQDISPIVGNITMVIFKNLPTTQYIEVMHAGNIIDSVYLRRGIVLLDNYD
jgi:hypothetical protein